MMNTTLSLSKSIHVSSSFIVKRKSQVNYVSVNKYFTCPCIKKHLLNAKIFFHKQKECSKPHAILSFFIFRVGNMNFIIFVFSMDDNTMIFSIE